MQIMANISGRLFASAWYGCFMCLTEKGVEMRLFILLSAFIIASAIDDQIKEIILKCTDYLVLYIGGLLIALIIDGIELYKKDKKNT